MAVVPTPRGRTRQGAAPEDEERPRAAAQAIEIPFDMDFSKLADLRESFDCYKSFSLKHTLGFKIHRPWWTFAIVRRA